MEYTKERLSDPTFRAWIGRPDEGYEDDLTPGRILEEAAYELEATKAEESADWEEDFDPLAICDEIDAAFGK